MGDFHRRAFSFRGEPSSKRIIAGWAAAALIAGTALLSICISFRVLRHGDVGAGAVTALATMTLPLATLAGVVQRKPDRDLAGSPAPGATPADCGPSANPNSGQNGANGGSHA